MYEPPSILAFVRLTRLLGYVDCSQTITANKVYTVAQHAYEHINASHIDKSICPKLISHFVAINYQHLTHSELEGGKQKG